MCLILAQKNPPLRACVESGCGIRVAGIRNKSSAQGMCGDRVLHIYDFSVPPPVFFDKRGWHNDTSAAISVSSIVSFHQLPRRMSIVSIQTQPSKQNYFIAQHYENMMGSTLALSILHRPYIDTISTLYWPLNDPITILYQPYTEPI